MQMNAVEVLHVHVTKPYMTNGCMAQSFGDFYVQMNSAVVLHIYVRKP